VKQLANLLPLLLIALVFYLLILRPQRRRQQELRSTQSALDVGTEVMLGSGMFGTVASLEDETVHLEVAPGIVVKVARQAIARVLDEPDDRPDEERDQPTYDRVEGGDELPGSGDQHQ